MVAGGNISLRLDAYSHLFDGEIASTALAAKSSLLPLHDRSLANDACKFNSFSIHWRLSSAAFDSAPQTFRFVGDRAPLRL